MSTINVANLELQITKKIRTATTDKELAILNKALYVLQTGVIFTVGTFGNLPSADDNEGKLYFVESDALLYFSFTTNYSSVAQWIPITNVNVNTLWSWGQGSGGRLGDGTAIDRCSPGTVAGGGSTWCDVSVAYRNSSAIKCDGTLWTWGRNCCGMLGNGTTVSRCSPGTVSGGGTTWKSISSGSYNSVALKTDGTLWSWGCNPSGQLGDGTTLNRCSPVNIVVGAGNSSWCQVGIGWTHGVAIKTDGTIWTWGNNNCGQLGDGTTIDRSSPGTVWGSYTNWCKICAGLSHTMALKTDGTLWTWGRSVVGILGDGTTLNRCSPGTIAAGGTTWCDISSGSNFDLAIKTDGTIWTWGGNNQGRLGDGTAVNRCSPGTVSGGGTTWCGVFSMGYGGAAIKTDGTMWTWGSNVCGKLGEGTLVSRCSPGTIVSGGTTWWKLSGLNEHMLAITKETL